MRLAQSHKPQHPRVRVKRPDAPVEDVRFAGAADTASDTGAEPAQPPQGEFAPAKKRRRRRKPANRGEGGGGGSGESDGAAAV